MAARERARRWGAPLHRWASNMDGGFKVEGGPQGRAGLESSKQTNEHEPVNRHTFF